MCGFYGIAFRDRAAPVDERELTRLTNLLTHRGPDELGVFSGAGVGLGFRRLSIIDLAHSHQPMTSACGRYTAVFNGEIYNFRELRDELRGEGMTFRTTGDTEVVVNGFARWGGAVAERLWGMFAIAVWDRIGETLTLIRDRTGQKPLAIAELPCGGIAFASEVTPLIAGGFADPTPDADTLWTYLTHGYTFGEHAFCRGVRRLEPASRLAWSRAAGIGSPEPYWRARANAPAAPATEGETEERFLDLLGDAVRRRNVADVPLGAFLSGGVDSGVISALATEQGGEPLRTFSVGFRERSYSELPEALRTAEAIGSRHTDAVIDASSLDALDHAIAALDEPLGDTSIVPTTALCRWAREHVTVALSGDGGDELLAGYITHHADELLGRVGFVPRRVWRVMAAASRAMPDSDRKVSALFKIKQFLAGASLEPDAAHGAWRRLTPRDLLARVAADAPPPGWDGLDAFRRAAMASSAPTRLGRYLDVDNATWLPDDINVKVDRASMAASLEVRSPFLDHRLIEFCATLPDGLKRNGSVGKVLLKRVGRRLLPEETFRRRKAGFNAPVASWLRSTWRGRFGDLIATPNAAVWSLLDRSAVRATLDEHLDGRRDHGYHLFTVLSLGLWLKRAAGHRSAAPAGPTVRSATAVREDVARC